MNRVSTLSLRHVSRTPSAAFTIGQKVRFGSRWRPITGEVIAYGTSDLNGSPQVCVRYYDDPNRFGHPYPIEVEIPAHRVQAV